MNTFKVEATHKTPEIEGNIEEGKFSIKGKCIPEDARGFFIPFRDWFMQFVQSDCNKIYAELDLEYFNTSTSSILLDVFKQLDNLSNKKEVEITWIYEEDDFEMEEVGQDYKLMIGENFKLQSKPWEN
ncbi:DUF1987 domain-containing protein [Paracrocinitomix mangrovi]|uniref:DUF1987 domain-containing protein n=1 Tax=Paracrocinitomix mangrovi TaxID=2862509 RepID=UPI001C8E8D7E|nr:DUF1987 domain-containing protein [Paracrocinitomix mangrovi]UKN03665.1 DUF1987 domain-containing protein [Paracrocinitomix mangrovi]